MKNKFYIHTGSLPPRQVDEEYFWRAYSYGFSKFVRCVYSKLHYSIFNLYV